MANDSDPENIISNIKNEIKSESSSEGDRDGKDDSLSKEEIKEQFDGKYIASPTGNTQHLVKIDAPQTLCKMDLDKKEWPQSSEPGPFNPICDDCRSVLIGPVKPTGETGLGTLNQIRNWFAERVEIRPAKDVAGSKALTKAELQLVAEYIQSLESDNDTEL